ncbi:unnamed protein product [Ostreobium quekettii]|uniref:GATA-type domain-containing protein n=1 Tax=Ostreobium quekettii TaxID=121088 RepID=A0A8S1IU87_9CHLO|nr:unnamed protein product [Ostreobium quekettii]
MKGKVRRGCGGPCNHCGRTCSPCWRKGPPEKPVLCNACGARYLVKRNLEGYMPGQKATGGVTPREPPRTEARSLLSCDRASSGSSDRSTGDRRSVSSSSLSHSPGARPRRRRRVLYRPGGDEDLDWDVMETDGAGGEEGWSWRRFEIGPRGSFAGEAMASDQVRGRSPVAGWSAGGAAWPIPAPAGFDRWLTAQEYLEDLARVAACTLAMLRCSGPHLKAAKGHAVRRGAVVKPPQHRYRFISQG